MDFVWQKISQFGGFLGNLVYNISSRYTARPMEEQEKLLASLMEKNKDTEYGRKYGFGNVCGFDDFQKNVPLAEYSDFEPYVERMIAGEQNLITSKKIKRYVSTSGSAGKPKLIPLCGKAIWNMQIMGFCAPLGATANYYKKLGRKMPPQRSFLTLEVEKKPLPNGNSMSILSALPFLILKPISRFFSSSPKELLYPENSAETDMNYLKLLFALSNPKVSALCAPLVTYLVNIFELLEKTWPELCDDIEHGTINPSVRCPEKSRKALEKRLKPDPERAAFLRCEFEKGFDTPIGPRIWPALEWTSAMRKGNLVYYADKLKKYCGDLPYNNTGFISSECLMAMSLEMSADDGVLLPKSALYEFIPTDDPDIERPLLLDKLEEGKEYEIVITNLGGLWRYKMHDVVRCTGYYQKTPKVEFVRRSNLILNITGEKTTQLMLDWAMQQTRTRLGCEVSHYCVYGELENTDEPKYIILVEPEDNLDRGEFARVLDGYLCETNFFYNFRRGKDILGCPVVKFLNKGAFDDYAAFMREKGVNLNQVKPVTILNTEEKLSFFTDKIINS